MLLRGTGENSAIGLYSLSLPSTLDGYVKTNTLTSWDPNFGVMLPSYINLTGGYTVAATMVPSPFRVTESAPDESGLITYTAEPLYGLHFSNPSGYGHLPPGDLVWKFFPGDSLSDKPDFSWPGWYMYECERKLVCQFRPPGPGRMQVSAFVERQTAYVRSTPATAACPEALGASLMQLTTGGTPTGCAPPAEIAVQCQPDTLIAGNRTTCTAAVSPSGLSLTVTSWKFVGDSLGTTLSADGDLKSWTFAPPVCGTVTVAGTVEGIPKEAQTRVEVLCNFLDRVTNDSVIDHPTVQQELRRLWANTLLSGVEQGSVILRRGGVYRAVPYAGPSSRCSSAAGDITIQAPDTLVAFLHTHPDPAGTPNPCPDGSSTEVVRDGPSFKDNQSARRLRRYASVPGYIVDHDHVHRYGSTTLPTTRWDRNRKCP